MKHHLSFYCFKPWSLISKLSTNRYSYSAFNVPNVNNKHLFEVFFPGLFCVPWYHSLICTCLLLSMFPCLVLYVKLTLVSRSVASSCFPPPPPVTVAFCDSCCVYFPFLIMFLVTAVCSTWCVSSYCPECICFFIVCTPLYGRGAL